MLAGTDPGTPEKMATGASMKPDDGKSLRLSIEDRRARGIGGRTVKDGDVADARHEVAGTLFGENRRQLLFLLLQIGELDLDELMLRQSFVEALEKRGAQALFADAQHRFQTLSHRFQFSNLSVCESDLCVVI